MILHNQAKNYHSGIKTVGNTPPPTCRCPSHYALPNHTSSAHVYLLPWNLNGTENPNILLFFQLRLMRIMFLTMKKAKITLEYTNFLCDGC